jgi:hypothetical protein
MGICVVSATFIASTRRLVVVVACLTPVFLAKFDDSLVP